MVEICMSRIRNNFYGNPRSNKKVTRFDAKLAFFKEISSLLLTNQHNSLFIILTYQNKELPIKIKQSSENSNESVF